MFSLSHAPDMLITSFLISSASLKFNYHHSLFIKSKVIMRENMEVSQRTIGALHLGTPSFNTCTLKYGSQS